MSATVGMGLHTQCIQVAADGGHRQFAAAGDNVAIDQHQGELSIRRQGRAVGVEEVVIGEGNGRSVLSPQFSANPASQVAPGFFNAISTGHRRTDDLNTGWLAHPQPHPPEPQPQDGPLIGKGRLSLLPPAT